MLVKEYFESFRVRQLTAEFRTEPYILNGFNRLKENKSKYERTYFSLIFSSEIRRLNDISFCGKD